MMKLFTSWILIFGVTVILSENIFCQNYFSKAFDIINESESGWQIINNHDYYYIIAPSHCAIGGLCTSIIKFDKSFDIIWEKTFPGIGIGSLTSMVLKDSTILFYGILYAPIDTLGLSVIQLNFDGDILNQWYYGTSDSDDPLGISLNNQNGFNIVISQKTGVNKNNLWLLNCNSNGTILWKRQYGNEYRHTNIHSILQTENGGSLLGCTGCLEPDCEYIEGFTLELDSVGNIVYKIIRDTVSLGNTLYTYAIPVSIDGIIMSRSIATNYYPFEIPVIYKFDSLGRETWKYKFQPEEYSAIFRLKLAKNGDILGVGLNESHPYIDTTYEISRLFGGWIFRISSQGILKWNRIIGDLRFPGPGFGELIDISEDEEGNIIAIGDVQDTLTGITPPYLTWDVWVLYLDSTGCLIPECNPDFNGITKTNNITIANPHTIPFSISPNPVNDILDLRYNGSIDRIENFQIQVINNIGQIQLENTFTSLEALYEIQIMNLPQGIYYLNIFSKLSNYCIPFAKN